MSTDQTNEAGVHALRTGANGIPDLPVDADVAKRPSENVASSERETSGHAVFSRQDSLISLIAVGLIAMGTIGADPGLTQVRRRSRAFPLGAVPDPHSLTPPHGDKLMRHQ